MYNETMAPAVEAAGPTVSSEISEVRNLREAATGEGITDAVRNAIKILGVTAAIVVIPGAIPVATVTGAVWLANKMRSQNK